jgi:phospholipid-translocating ATPase
MGHLPRSKLLSPLIFQSRKLELNGTTLPTSFLSNKLNNQKYNILSFVPTVLYNEFKFFFNMFFLIIAMS